MAYRFAGFFARPAVPRPAVLSQDAVWREIAVPFVGIGVRLPSLFREDDLPAICEVHALARQLGLEESDCWLYLTYICWGGDIDFVYGFGCRAGVKFGPVKEFAGDKVEGAYTGLMAQFGISADEALRFEPFERDYWGE